MCVCVLFDLWAGGVGLLALKQHEMPAVFWWSFLGFCHCRWRLPVLRDCF